MTRDRVTGLISLIIGIIVAISTLSLPDSKMPGDIGPKAFPFIASGILIICGGGLLATGGKKAEPVYDFAQLRRLGLIVCVVLAYIILMYLIGFIIPTLLASFALSTMFAKVNTVVPAWKRAVFSIAITAAIYVSFGMLLSMKLPSGILF